MGAEEKDIDTIVELLKKDCLLKTENNLKQKIGEIIQDFIDRGLYNSTVCTGKQLQAHFDHIDKLIDHILESLKQDFAYIPLEKFKEKLLTIVDEEYKKLFSVANSHLVSAGLAQQSILKDFEHQINNKKEKAKQSIETKFAILEKQMAASKNKKEAKQKEGVLEAKPPEILQKLLWIWKNRRKNWKLLVVAGLILLIIFAAGLFREEIRTWISGFHQAENEIGPSPQEIHKNITLLYLFENDFSNLLRASEDRILTDTKDGSQTTVKSKLYLDFESQTEFIGFYIPPVPETFDICVHLVENYQTALELTKKVMVESSAPGLQPVNTSELKFSGRVFIYHEYPLLEAQKRKLFALYQKHDLSPQFRGADYLFEKKQIEKSR